MFNMEILGAFISESDRIYMKKEMGTLGTEVRKQSSFKSEAFKFPYSASIFSNHEWK